MSLNPKNGSPSNRIRAKSYLDTLGEDEINMELELDTSQWANLWMSCMSELRNGVTLKHCERRHSPIPTQFELTPYEMLMSDIAHKNWKLKKSKASNFINGELSIQTRKNAHQIIMEHIRSRPALVPTNRRHLKPAPPKKQSLHEVIMGEIKKPSSRALLRYSEVKERKTAFPVGNVLPDNFNSQIEKLNKMNDTYDNLEYCDSSHRRGNLRKSNSTAVSNSRNRISRENELLSIDQGLRPISISNVSSSSNNQQAIKTNHYPNINKNRLQLTEAPVLSDSESTDELGYENDSNDEAMLYNNHHCFEKFEKSTNESHSNDKHRYANKKFNSKYINHLEIDDAMDIVEQQDQNQMPRQRSKSSANHKKRVPLDDWNSSTNSNSTPTFSPRNKQNNNRNNNHNHNHFSQMTGQIYVNPAITESCGNILSQFNNGFEDFADEIDSEGRRYSSSSTGNFENGKERKSKNKKHKKDKNDKNRDDDYFKRSYTVHGLSSAARKLRRSFGKGSQKALDKISGKSSNSNSINSSSYTQEANSASWLSQNTEIISNQLNSNKNKSSQNRQTKPSANSSSSSISPDHFKNLSHKPLKKFTHKNSNRKYQEHLNQEKSVDLSKGPHNQAKNVTMHQLWAHPVECLSLKLGEVQQIRKTLTMGECEKFRHQKALHSNLVNGKICFVCKIRSFGMFVWRYQCPLCIQKICYKCLRKGYIFMQNKNNQSDNISNGSGSIFELANRKISFDEKDPSANKWFFDTPAHNIKIDMENSTSEKEFKNLKDGEFKICLDCAEMLCQIKNSSNETVKVAHAVNSQNRVRSVNNRETELSYQEKINILNRSKTRR